MASATGSEFSPKYCCHSAAGFLSPKSMLGIVPSISVRWPRTQSGWQPPFGVGNVVAAPLISSITLNTAPFETVSANLIASFVCIFFPPGIGCSLSITIPERSRIRAPGAFLRRDQPRRQRLLLVEPTDNARSPRCARCADRSLRVEQQNLAATHLRAGAARRLPARRPLLQLSVAMALFAARSSQNMAIRRSGRQSDLRRGVERPS